MNLLDGLPRARNDSTFLRRQLMLPVYRVRTNLRSDELTQLWTILGPEAWQRIPATAEFLGHWRGGDDGWDGAPEERPFPSSSLATIGRAGRDGACPEPLNWRKGTQIPGLYPRDFEEPLTTSLSIQAGLVSRQPYKVITHRDGKIRATKELSRADGTWCSQDDATPVRAFWGPVSSAQLTKRVDVSGAGILCIRTAISQDGQDHQGNVDQILVSVNLHTVAERW